MRREKLRLELLQKFLPLLFDSVLLDNIFRQNIGCGLHRRNDRYNAGRDALFAVASGTGIEVGGIVEPAIRTWQAVAGGRTRRFGIVTDSISQVISNVAADIALRLQDGWCDLTGCGCCRSRQVHDQSPEMRVGESFGTCTF